jgi:putative PIG3 family NAD(P)H quinone oxidoreductase
MKAIVIVRPGGPEVLELKDYRDPTAGSGEVLVRVRATAVNRADLLQRMGAYPAPPDVPPDIPGLEFAGEIAALGAGVTDWQVGDRVCGLAGGGTYAEKLVLHGRALSRIPGSLSFAEAAAIPEAFLTAYDAMVVQGRLASGETVLVSAVGSGVGTAAVQIARAVGARSIGTSRTQDKLDRARALGMSAGVLASGGGGFAQLVREQNGGRGVDLVLELVGGGYLAEDLACIAPRGRILLVGLMAGVRTEVDLGAILRHRVEVRGTTLRMRPLEEKIAVAQVFNRHLAPLFAAGALAPVIHSVVPLARAAEAHALLGSNDVFGKVVLEI